MTKYELLVSYRRLAIEIDTLEKQSNFLNGFIGGPRPVHAVALTGMPRGTNNPEAAMIQREENDDVIYKLERKCAEIRELLGKFEVIMEEIPDKWDELIIRDYYALRMTDKQIGKRLNFSQSTVWKRRSNVIEQLKQEYI